MLGEEEGVEERAEADEGPFEGDVGPFRDELEQQRKTHREIKEPPEDIDDRRGVFRRPGARRTASETSGR